MMNSLLSRVYSSLKLNPFVLLVQEVDMVLILITSVIVMTLIFCYGKVSKLSIVVYKIPFCFMTFH